MSKDDEIILAVQRSQLGDFWDTHEIPHGFIPAGYHTQTKILRRSQWVRRGDVEQDPSFKQIIPYLVLRDEAGRVLVYNRLKLSGEQRLVGKASIGIGGHITKEENTQDALSCVFDRSVDRELREELDVKAVHRSTPLTVGFLNEDESEVGKVHFGVLLLMKLRLPRVSSNEDSVIGNPSFKTLTECREGIIKFERWSQIVLDTDAVDLDLKEV